MNQTRRGQWWKTIPGLLTAIATTLTAIAGLLLALQQTGFITISTKRDIRAASDDCAAKIAEFQSLQRPVLATITSTNMNGTVSYSQIQLTFSGGAFVELTGRGTQFFNDRPAGLDQPFSKDRTDQLEMQVVVAGQDVVATFTLLSWNSGRTTLKLQCVDDFMYAFSPDRKGIYTIHLSHL